MVSYFFEFGVFLLGGWFWWRHRRRPTDRRTLALALLAAASLLLTSFLRSAIRFNDFSFRGTLPAQFVLLLATAAMLERVWRSRRRPAVTLAFLAIGFVAVPFDWILMGAYSMAMDVTYHHGITGRRSWALKRLYEQIRAKTPSDAIVQHNPPDGIEGYHGFYAHRPTAVMDWANGSLFATEGPLFDEVLTEVRSIFNRELSAEKIEQIARKYGIRVLVVKDRDPAWSFPVWHDPRFRLLASCEYGRAYELH